MEHDGQGTSLPGSKVTRGLTQHQCRMARAGLGMGVRELAKLADVSTNTITRLERGEGIYPRTQTAIREALQLAGVEFIAENGGGAGVRLRKEVKPRQVT